MSDELDMEVADIKTKILCLRSQLGRELNKTRSKKSGQGVAENYKSTWVFWQKLQFLLPVMQAGKSRDSLSSTTSRCSSPESADTSNWLKDQDDLSNSIEEEVTPLRRNKRKKTPDAESQTRNELSSTCIQVLQKPFPAIEPETKRQCSFSLYIAEKLAKFDKRSRMIAEK